MICYFATLSISIDLPIFIHSELVELGRTDVALDVLAKRGDWDRLWEVAAKEKMASSTLAKFVIMRVEEVRLAAL